MSEEVVGLITVLICSIRLSQGHEDSTNCHCEERNEEAISLVYCPELLRPAPLQ